MNKIVLLIATLHLTSAFADDIRLGNPVYGGTGCPQGTAAAVLSPDQKTLSLLFDQYQAEAGRTTGRPTDRKSCNIAIPVHVPQGYSIALFQMDYRGFNSLPTGGSSQLNVEYFFAGQSGPIQRRTFHGALNANYVVSKTLAAEALVWSPCGGETNLRVNSSIIARTNSSNEQAMATVDTADLKSGLIYHLQWKQCQ